MNLLAPLSIGFVLVALQAVQIPSESEPVPQVAPSSPVTAVLVPDPEAELVTARCTVCHPATRYDDKHLTAEQWQRVVARMISHGARVASDEEPGIVAWLTTYHGPEDAPAAPMEAAPANSVEAQ